MDKQKSQARPLGCGTALSVKCVASWRKDFKAPSVGMGTESRCSSNMLRLNSQLSYSPPTSEVKDPGSWVIAQIAPNGAAGSWKHKVIQMSANLLQMPVLRPASDADGSGIEVREGHVAHKMLGRSTSSSIQP